MTIETTGIPRSADLDALLEKGLSSRARYGHVALLLVAAGMTVVVGALLMTEPALPARTFAAFVVLLLIGAGWVVYAGWVLKHRWTLLAGHRVVAGVMAVVFSTVFSAGAAWTALATGSPAAWAAAATGGFLLAVAVAILARARRHRARLEARRARLERDRMRARLAGSLRTPAE